MLTLTPQQQGLIDALIIGQGHICLRARAGTGKTATILAATAAYAAAFPRHEVTICAFGKAIQLEIEKKLKARGFDDWKRFRVATSHSMGWSLVRSKAAFNNCKVDNNKVRDLIRAQNEPVFNAYGSQVGELVHLAKLEGFGFFDDAQIGDTHAWYAMADHYNVNGFDDTSDMDRVIEAAQRIYRLSLDTVDVVDFDDMVLFPLVKNLRVRFSRDLIFIDEAQDTSRARRALVQKFLKPNGRLVIVGDDRQAIMGFAGASADALDEWVRLKNATVLPLTTTWRCPKKVVELAQTIVPDIVAADDAKEGSVTNVEELPTELRKTDAILCRNTAPLISTAYALIKRGVACKVEGRDLATGLLRIVNRWTVTSVGAFLDRLEDYRAREVQKAIAKGKDAKAEQVNDQCETLFVICDAVRVKTKAATLDDVRVFINNLFSDNVTEQGMLTLCSMHRSKGREWPRVFILEYAKRCPSPWAKQPWELRQEQNLMYVALTRAQEELVFVA